MYKKITALLFIIAVSVCFGDGNTKIMESNPEPGGLYLSGALPVSGSYTFTNDYTHPWRMASLWYSLPASQTNTLTIQISRYDRTITEGADTLVTNEFNEVETNYNKELTITTVTNAVTIFTDSVTNVQSVVYTDKDDLPNNLYVMKNDILTFTMTRTNQTYLLFNGIR